MKALLKKIFVIESSYRVWKLLSGNLKRRIGLIILALFVNAILELLGIGILIPIFGIIGNQELPVDGIMGGYVDLFGIESYMSYIISICSTIFIIVVLKNLLSLQLHYFTSNFAYELANHFSREVLRMKIVQGGNFLLANENSHNSNWEMNVVPQHFVNFLLLPTFNVIVESLVVIMIVGGLLWYNYLVVMILAIVLMPIYFFLYSSTKNRVSSMEKESGLIHPKVNALGQLMIFGYADMMITNSQAYFTNKYKASIDRLKNLKSKLYVLKKLPEKIAEIGVVIAAVALLLYGVFMIPGGDLLELMGVFGLAAFRMLPSANRIMLALMSIKGYQYTLDTLEDLKSRFDNLPVQKKEDSSITPLYFNQELKVDGLSFAYDNGLDILKDLNFKVSKGEVVGIIGRSGSGKTTLMKLLLGFLNPSQGEITIDGVQLEESKLKSWRKIVGYVAQDVFVMEGTLRENIVFGEHPEAVDEALLKNVIDLACLTNLVDELPEGLETLITENGASLSGGQRQRIGIARAIYSGAEILFFDEATSALDNETEEAINDSIRSLMAQDLTIVVIAHRYTSLKHCSRIYELSEGVISRELTYDELA